MTRRSFCGSFFGFFGGQRSTKSSVLRRYDEHLAHRWTSEKLITHIQVVFALNFTTCQCWMPLRLDYILAAQQPLFITYQRPIWQSLILKRYRPGAQQFDSLEELITNHGQQLHSTVLIVVQNSPRAEKMEKIHNVNMVFHHSCLVIRDVCE